MLTAPKAQSPILTEFDQLLENMIGLQKKEQELILARRTDDLAATTQSIEWMGLRMQSMEGEVRRELEKAKTAGAPEKHIGEKLAHIKRLAQHGAAGLFSWCWGHAWKGWGFRAGAAWPV